MSKSYRQQFSSGSLEEADQLVLGREAYEERAWDDAYRFLSSASEAAPLAVDDLERLAMAAYLVGRDDACMKALEWAHRKRHQAGEMIPAARAAFLLGLRLAGFGDVARASGWFARAARLIETDGRDCVEQGYLLLPNAMQQLATGDGTGAYATAGAAIDVGNRFSDPDLVAYARQLQGRALIQDRRVQEGLTLFDEAMIAIIAGELTPLFSGLIYCSVIEGCQQVYALRRAHEWTSALAEWCRGQPQMLAYTGSCLLHRAEIMQLNGAWLDAMAEARRAGDLLARVQDQLSVAQAHYQQAEVHRLRGEFTIAEEAYRQASQGGRDPHPGLALLRLAEGHPDAALAAIRPLVRGTTGWLQRTKLLPAYIEVALAAGDVQEAHIACDELERVAKDCESDALDAIAMYARGTVNLAESDAQAALDLLRSAYRVWQEVEAPYLAARVRVEIGLACHMLGDQEGAALEFDAAEAAFKRLGAAPDLARLRGLAQSAQSTETHGLTAREQQVLRLLAAGKTNRMIAAELELSAKTVGRHVGNIFTKLDVPSRAAATAYAYRYKLL